MQKTHSIKVDTDNAQLRLDVFLTQNLSDVPSRSFVQKLIEHGHVKVDERVVKSNYKVQVGEEVLVEVPDHFLASQYIAPEEIVLDIFYEDQYLLIINKPNGMLVHPAGGNYSGTLVNALLHHSVNLSNVNEEMRPGIVHRLDQETSGLMIVAKDNITHTKLAKQFKRHEVKKRYVAIVEGEIEFEEGKINEPIGRHPLYRELQAVRYDDSAKEAITFYKVLKRGQNKTLVALFPQSGRTHQLRVHMKYIKHPILGDDKYGKKHSFSRLALHAQAIGFKHPATKEFIEFHSQIPKEFLKDFK